MNHACYPRHNGRLAFALLAHQGGTTQALAAPKATAAAPKPPAAATEKWEGYWAKNQKECRSNDSADSKTMIDLKNSENGKPAPLYDQYENHCRVDSLAAKGNVKTLKLTCFEFWDDYKAKKNSRRDTVTVTVTTALPISDAGNSLLPTLSGYSLQFQCDAAVPDFIAIPNMSELSAGKTPSPG